MYKGLNNSSIYGMVWYGMHVCICVCVNVCIYMYICV